MLKSTLKLSFIAALAILAVNLAGPIGALGVVLVALVVQFMGHDKAVSKNAQGEAVTYADMQKASSKPWLKG